MGIVNTFLVSLGIKSPEATAPWWKVDEETDASLNVDLNEFAQTLSKAEGLKKRVPLTQVKELLGLLGDRWRELPEEQVKAEIAAVINRAGLRGGNDK